MPAAEPPVTFSTFIVSLASSALAHLGRAEGVDVPEDRALAVQTLEVLDLLATKTRGNLDPEEARLLDALCAELRGAIADR
ncbi:MAG: DUF1844 domain-containing protein [Deltaproteobacteria bacterium]|nr:DUF1844 domain-containing protein [Deltaproteobacteria bacterium]